MATKQAPAMPAAGEGAAAGGGGNRAPPQPPRRGQIKEKILKDVVAAVASIAAGLVGADKNGRGGSGGGRLPAAGDDADGK